MTMKYYWEIEKILTISEDPIENIVTQVHWTKTGVDEHGRTGVHWGITEFTKASLGESFIPFDQLNKQIVFSWVMSSINSAMHKSIDESIEFNIYQKTYVPQEVTPTWLSEPLVQE